CQSRQRPAKLVVQVKLKTLSMSAPYLIQARFHHKSNLPFPFELTVPSRDSLYRDSISTEDASCCTMTRK
ncbi:hypothetical protein ACVNHC_23535, partial [Pannonibacter sp. Q-1]